MMAIDESFAKAHIGKWINSWNDHGLKAIVSFYAENIEFRSLKIKVIYPENKCHNLQQEGFGRAFFLRTKKVFKIAFYANRIHCQGQQHTTRIKSSVFYSIENVV
jgi:hypothetical protein